MSNSGCNPGPLGLAAALGAGLLFALQQLLPKRQNGRKRPNLEAAANGGAKAPPAGQENSLWQPNPHPNWLPPQKLPAPFSTDEMRTVDPAQLPADVLYPLVISAVVPRPIGFVSTQNSQGVGNLAPYSCKPGWCWALQHGCAWERIAEMMTSCAETPLALWPTDFNVLAHHPPTVALGCCASRLRSHGRKDTLVNILETG